MTDFKWKSGNLVSLSRTVMMSNFHYGDLHSCTYRLQSSLLTVLAEVVIIVT